MKKYLFLFAALFCIAGLGYTQSLESMGDEAFVNGKYKEAIEYYKQANNVEPSNALKEKITKSQTLKTEFEIIDSAIAASDFEKAKIHIDKVLSIDPTNLWVNDRKSKLGIKETHERFKGINGEYFNFNVPRGLELGVGMTLKRYNRCFSVSFCNYSHFPWTLDFRAFTNEISIPYDRMFAGGLGTAYILSKNLTVDLGGGVLCTKDKLIISWDTSNDPEAEPEFARLYAPYIKAGLSLRFLREWLTLSYEWMYGFSSSFPIRNNMLILKVHLGRF